MRKKKEVEEVEEVEVEVVEVEVVEVLSNGLQLHQPRRLGRSNLA